MKVAPFGIATFTLLLAVAGCGNPSGDNRPGAPYDEPGLRGRTFLSTAVTEDGKPRQLAGKTRVRLQFTDDGRLIADVGCNSMQGQVSVGGGRIEVFDLSATGMGCDKPLLDQDSWLSRFLGGKPDWRMDGANLVVSSGNTKIVLADRAAAEPDLALEGTRWVVDTIIDDEVASSMPTAGAAALVFEKNTVKVATG